MANSAETKTLTWDIPTTREDGSVLAATEIDEYWIYISQTPGEIVAGAVVPDTLIPVITVLGGSAATQQVTLDPGDYEIAITTVDLDALESKFSNVIAVSIPNTPPSATTIYLSFTSTAVPGFANNIPGREVVTAKLELKDQDGNLTGVIYESLGFDGTRRNRNIAERGEHWGWNFRAWNGYAAFWDIEPIFSLSGLPAGRPYSIRFAGASGNELQETTYLTDGAGSAQYISASQGFPAEPVMLSGVVPDKGEIVAHGKPDTYMPGVLNAIEIIY